MNKELKNIKNIPNILSLFRLICAPIFMVLFFVFSPNYIPAFIVFIIASVTDMVDGFIARKYNLITNLGIVLDPLADKLLKISVFLSFGISGVISWWLVGIVVGIDICMIIIGIILFHKQITIPSNIIGKTGTFVITIGLLTCFFPNIFSQYSSSILYIGVGIILSSIILYVAKNFKDVVNKLKNKKSS